MSTRNPQQQLETLHETAPSSESAAADPAPDVDSIETVVIHTDGSFHQENNLSGTGFTLETNAGETFREEWNLAPNAKTSMETEAAAALAAVREAKKFDPSYIILYSDCKPVVQVLDDETEPADHRDAVYKRAREILATVEFTTITYIPRERNKQAHDLAHRALREAREQRKSGVSDTGTT